MLNKLPIGHTFTAELFLYEHTWFGLYKVFLTDERNKAMYQNILYGSNARNAKGQPQISGAQAVLSSEIKYCPICVSNDEETYGEVYVHREHQLSFLQLCPSHRVQLFSKCPTCMNSYGDTHSGHLLKEVACKWCGDALPSGEVELNLLYKMQIKLLDDLVFVRDNHMTLSVDTLYVKLMQLLFANNYITLRGELKKKEILSFIKGENAHFKIMGYDLLNIGIKYFRGCIFSRNSMVKFIPFYFLLAQLLSDSLKQLIESENTYAIEIPFGNGPWACLNRKCETYGLPRINHCARDVNNSSGVYSIKYYCDNCKHVSRMKGEVTSVYKMKKTDNIQLAINEIQVARQQVAAVSSTNFEDRREEKRMAMIKLLTGRTYRTRTELRKQAQYLFSWLMHYDKEWLVLRIPPEIYHSKKKLDFSAIDQELQQKIREAAESIPSDYHLPIRRGTIISKLSKLYSNRFKQYYRDKLPLAVLELDKYVETTQEYLIRSIPRYYLRISARYSNGMTVNQFKNKATGTYYQKGNEEVDEHIRVFLSERGKLI
ncbi:Tn7-like transposition protein D [Paenibacillus sp. FSL R7-277]|nr:Tn7-like transposition protein D [Paenibacillus sp. FSL R7-277]